MMRDETSTSFQELEFFLSSLSEKDFRSFLLVCKEILKSSSYFILYYRYFAKDLKSVLEMADLFSCKRQNIYKQEYDAFLKVKPYLFDSSLRFAVLERIYEIEGNDRCYLSVEPMYPQDIVQYFFVKPFLTEEEVKLFRLYVFQKYKVFPELFSKKLDISKEEYLNTLFSLQAKLDFLCQDLSTYACFEKQCMRKYKTRIFRTFELDE